MGFKQGILDTEVLGLSDYLHYGIVKMFWKACSFLKLEYDLLWNKNYDVKVVLTYGMYFKIPKEYL